MIFSLDAVAQVPVMLHLNREGQPDTLITNFPAEIAALVHPIIVKEELALWDTPQKQIKISPAGLQNLEQNAGTEFSAATDLFIYELWKENKKTIQTDIVGISFTYRSKSGRETVFGFIDYMELLPHLRQKIPVSVNGSYNTTFADIFSNKMYSFNVVQHNHKTIKTLDESKQIIAESITGKKLSNARAIPQNKLVNYIIKKNATGQELIEKNTQSLIFAFERFFSENPEIFLNFGGDSFVNDFSAPDIYISSFEVEELWTKNSDGTINYQPLHIRFYVNEIPLQPISASHWLSWNISVNGKAVEEFLKEKKFIFTINRINNQNISNHEAGLFQKALYNYDWNKLSAYVNNF